MLRIVFVLLLFLQCVSAQSHGLTSAAAKMDVRPNNLVELQVQFDLIDLLNHKSNDYSLAVIASLPGDKFGLFYNEIIKLFDENLVVTKDGEVLKLHKRYPSQTQVFNLLKREFIDSTISAAQKNIPYTFDDRRFYQVFSFDFRVGANDEFDGLKIDFPRELGNVYFTFSRSITRDVHKGESWLFDPSAAAN